MSGERKLEVPKPMTAANIRALAAALRSLAKSKLGARRKGAFKGRR